MITTTKTMNLRWKKATLSQSNPFGSIGSPRILQQLTIVEETIPDHIGVVGTEEVWEDILTEGETR